MVYADEIGHGNVVDIFRHGVDVLFCVREIEIAVKGVVEDDQRSGPLSGCWSDLEE
jgi:hypothetical protein